MYLVSCLIKLFTLATKTYEEQHRHVEVLQNLSNKLYFKANAAAAVAAGGGGAGTVGGGVSLLHPSTVGEGTPLMNPNLQAFHNDLSNWQVAEEDYLQLRDDGPIDIDESSSQDNEGAGDTTGLLEKPRKFSNVLSPKPKRQASSGGGGNSNFMDAITSNVFGRSLFSNSSTQQITSPSGGNPHAGNMFGSRSLSQSQLAEAGGGSSAVNRILSSNKLMLDVPETELGKDTLSVIAFSDVLFRY